MNYDFQRLKLLFERATCLPPLPASVFRLMEVTENNGASANQIAAITASDPMLCAKLLRAANGDWEFQGMARITSVPSAIMRLGLPAVRSMAISLGVQAMFNARLTGCLFDPICYARHSILVGLLGRYIFVRCKSAQGTQSNLRPDEVFAAGVLHDLPVALLAWVAPDAYDHVHLHCKNQGLSIERGFEEIFSGSIRELGSIAIRTWGLPSAFEVCARWVDQPLEAPSEKLAILSISYASSIADTNIADSNGYASAPWSCAGEIDPAVVAAVDIESEEIDMAFASVLTQIEFYLPSHLMNATVHSRRTRYA